MQKLAILGTGRGSAELYDLVCGVPNAATQLAASGQGRERPEIVFLDDNHPTMTEFEGHSVAGKLEHARELVSSGFRIASGIANARSPGLRAKIAERLALPEDAWLIFAHSKSTVSGSASLQPGVVLYPGVCVATHAVVGAHSVVYYNSVVHHDVVLGVGTVICAGVNIAGNVSVGDGAYLGVGCTVKDNVTIGPRAVVGAGAVVIRDVPADTTVIGVPARALERAA